MLLLENNQSTQFKVGSHHTTPLLIIFLLQPALSCFIPYVRKWTRLNLVSKSYHIKREIIRGRM